MTELHTSDRVAISVMTQVGRELAELTSVGESLQSLVGAVANGAAVDKQFVVDVQRLDALVQHTGELALFLARLANDATKIGLCEEAVTRAAAPVRLSDLSDRLILRASTTPVRQHGECELW